MMLEAVIAIMPALDWLALAVFLLIWSGYEIMTMHVARSRTIGAKVAEQRLLWAQNVSLRDARIVDAALQNNLTQGCAFLASTTLLVAGALLALLSQGQFLSDTIGEIPGIASPSVVTVHFKTLVAALVMTHSFFKFTWCTRLFAYCAILMGSAPIVREGEQPDDTAIRHADALGNLHILAGDHYNSGLRSMFFTIAVVAGMLHWSAMIVASVWIMLVLYRREYRSRSWRIMDELNAMHRKANTR